jgi:hypothetical protein
LRASHDDRAGHGGAVMAGDAISILDGSTFVVSDRRGDIDAGPDQPHGLFYKDT